MKLSLLAFLFAAPQLGAQLDPAPHSERYGIIGSVGFGQIRLSLNSAPYQSKGIVSSRVGFRINPFWFKDSWRGFGLTPHLAFAPTDFRGMNAQRDSYAFADLALGLEASYRARRHLRPYVFYRWASPTAEHVDAGQIWNYSGHGRGVGGGIEFPILIGGSGFDVGFRAGSGRFKDAERLKAHRAIDVPYRAGIWHVGWSGSLRGM
jgi:hypothetical protein